MSEEQLVVFRLGNEEYGIAISQVREIIQYRNATKLPNTPEFMEGIISLRGKVIPVIELAKRFGLSADTGKDKRAIIIEVAGQDIGIIVTEVTEVLRLSGEQIEAVPAMTAVNECVRGIGKDANRLLILLDLGNLLRADEIRAIGAA
ncbi:MAG: cheW2 [Anaerosporomusa subterranea]|nr:cheW2 [Anaerosporomusa subterranea]